MWTSLTLYTTTSQSEAVGRWLSCDMWCVGSEDSLLSLLLRVVIITLNNEVMWGIFSNLGEYCIYSIIILLFTIYFTFVQSDLQWFIHTFIHWWWWLPCKVPIRSSLGFSILPKDTSTYRPGEWNQRPSDKKTMALPLSHSKTNTKKCKSDVFDIDNPGYSLAPPLPSFLGYTNNNSCS